MKKRFTLIGLAIFTLLAVTGCSHSANPTESIPHNLGFTYEQLDPNTASTDAPGGILPSEEIGTISDNTTLVAFLGGSSSCPPVIDKISNVSSTSVQILLKKDPSPVCTADFSITAFQITAVATNFDFHNKTVSVCKNDSCHVLTLSSLANS